MTSPSSHPLGLRPARLRRVQLAVPGSSEKMMAKAAASAADHVFLDLEDAVAPNRKIEARDLIVNALNTLDWGKKTRCVRINALDTPFTTEDVISLVKGAGENLDTLMLTKVKTPHDILYVDTMLRQLEESLGLNKRIGLEALIEEVEGLQNVDAIASSCDRLEALVFGMGDFSASMGTLITPDGKVGPYPGDLWHYARFRMTMACRAAGIDALDGPYADFRDEAGFREECSRSLTIGMVGKWAIHPNQIAWAQDVFTPDAEVVAHMRKLATAYEKAQEDGLGAIAVDGALVDAASIRMFGATLRAADLIGM
ncbi:citrate lyase subunit beta / citryl-CoA lyase [Albimonas donghaensis]|uniref:Citrate lyase subunit beta / citryl-CoA lyase n=1 Tax=Albimonas donghaensis TaxID=356660 RepID=A0A1H3DVQ6_9RHOB|nr:CoA ester lyase [Albimonas donghaensis]SDX69764.1 citrate lyase subunit beta / citryl-CoA lyase [Albimonas donghaensis]